MTGAVDTYQLVLCSDLESEPLVYDPYFEPFFFVELSVVTEKIATGDGVVLEAHLQADIVDARFRPQEGLQTLVAHDYGTLLKLDEPIMITLSMPTDFDSEGKSFCVVDDVGTAMEAVATMEDGVLSYSFGALELAHGGCEWR